jgi:hypothetical protein
MNAWFETTVKFEKIDEEGRQKKVTEKYLLDAVSFTEAETRIYKELEQMITGEFTVTQIKKSNISEVINYGTGHIWFRCKLQLITINESSGKEKKATQYMLVLADDVPGAHSKIEKNMDGIPVDYKVPDVTDPNICDVFYYEGKENAHNNINQIELIKTKETGPLHAENIFAGTKDNCSFKEWLIGYNEMLRHHFHWPESTIKSLDLDHLKTLFNKGVSVSEAIQMKAF